ncbi:Two component regulator propeller [Mariniphaga anaerophila]|uniref:histidine kinase n=1 Tax=Mariniphaga anaerophila TaxID=1484053 RepID=A0A1M5DMH2_9BACT|nr:two-component regulator propeller domain-containing protein [Mariniphaga anaerophila]SHF68173.1 Two component regulator propeller [Mariniphaga anaerophila]
MKVSKRLLIFLLSLTLVFSVVAVYPSVAFYHYGIENGLPESRIVAISQDSTGFIWLAGENSVFRFDGNRFITYQNTYSDDSSAAFVRINALFTDSRGTLWVGTNNGLFQFDIGKNQFVKAAGSLGESRILDFSEDKGGNLWIASDEGLVKFSPAIKKTVWFTDAESSINAAFKKLPTDYIRQVTCQPDGKIWLFTFPFGLYLFDPATNQVDDFSKTDGFDFSQTNISELHFSSGFLYVGTLSKGFFRMDATKRKVYDEPVNQSVRAIHHFQQMNDSVFWLATNNGLFRYNVLSENVTRYTNVPNNPLSLNRTTINFVYVDKNENLWLSLGIRGIDFGLMNVPFSHLLVSGDEAYELAQKEVTSIYFEHEGNMWLGYESGLIEKHSYAPKGKEKFRLPQKKAGVTPGSVMAIFEDSEKRTWAGGWMSGLNVLMPRANAFLPAKIKPDSVSRLVETADVRGIAEDAEGNIWVSFHGIGLGKYHPTTQSLKIYKHDEERPFSSLSNNYTYNFCFDIEGNLWIASAHGVSKFNPETEEFSCFFNDVNNQETLNSNTVKTVFCDSAGVVWAGTDKGLNAYSPAKNSFIPVFTDHDFSFLSISSIQSVNPGELWLSTNSGIFRVEYAWNEDETAMTIETKYFSRSDGLLSSNYFARAAATSGDGIVFFAGNEGIDYFDPWKTYSYKKPAAQVFISEILADGTPVFPQGVSEIGDGEKLVLKYGHKTLFIRFSGLDLSNPGTKNFRYKLEGLNDDWVYLQNEQMVSFTHLLPGTYFFTLEIQQNDKQWDGPNGVLQIVIKRPFWLSWLFYVPLLLIVAGVFLAVLKIRSRVLIARQRELERIIDERTKELTVKNNQLEIANQTKSKLLSIISHDLRSPFSGLLGILDLLTDPDSGIPCEKHTELLVAAKASANDTFELLENLLLWARSQMKEMKCRIEKQDLSKVLQKNVNLKKQIAAHKNITLSGHFPDALEASFDREMVNTVIRNILSNALKFTPSGGEVNLLAKTEGSTVIVSVADTGIGIKEENMEQIFSLGKSNGKGTLGEIGTGLGLVICKEFVERNGGKIWAEPNSPAGTVFHFSLPVNKESDR